MQNIDITFFAFAAIIFIIALVILAVAIICRKVWPFVKSLLPSSVVCIIRWIAETVVNAVEAEFGGEDGAVKRQEAFERIKKTVEPILSYLESKGFTIETDRIYEAIEAAWYKMNLEQIRAGIKDPPASQYE